MILKGIPPIISPDLLHALDSMGHGDRIVLADTNFPSASPCEGSEGPRLVRADGHNIPQLLEAVLSLIPLDSLEVLLRFYLISVYGMEGHQFSFRSHP